MDTPLTVRRLSRSTELDHGMKIKGNGGSILASVEIEHSYLRLSLAL